jgi:ELWxxDGT repeat protein
MSMRRPLPILLVALALGGAAFGQTARLTRDIAAGPGTNEGSDPDQLTLLGGRVVFRATEPTTGQEVWTSDGTPGGTALLREACPGPCSDEPEIVGSLNGTVLWVTFPDGYRPPVLWRTDGTRAGTFPLATGVGARPETLRDSLVFFQGALYFDRCDASISPSRCELWRTDGTAAGTGAALARTFSGELILYPAGERLFFFAREYPRPDLWVWSGTGSPFLVREDVEVPYDANVAAAGGRLFFVVDDGQQEIWVSDGTAAGTRAVSEFQPSRPIGSALAPLGSRVWVVANDVLHGDEIWVADGTPQGTRRVTEFPNYHPFEGIRPQVMEVGTRLVFPATDGITGLKLWATDGDPASTSTVRETVLAPDSPVVQAGGRVFAAAAGGALVTDGTARGTRLVEVCPGCDAQARLLQASGAGVLFVARSPATGFEIWLTDGTAEGTRALTSLPPAARPAPVPAARGGALYFRAVDGHGGELWRTDADGTRQVADIARAAAGPIPRDLAAVGPHLFFSACAADRREVWRGSPGSGVRLADLQDTQTCTPFAARWYDFTAVGSLLFYTRGSELWRSDGTETGTFQLLGPGSMYPPVEEVGGKALFVRTQAGTHDLWTSDGTPGGTVLAVDLPDLLIHDLEKVGQEVYFFATRQGSGVEVWRTDGTQAGTRRIATDVSYPLFGGFFVRSGPSVYFLADGDDGEEIWKTDGTAAGTTRLVTGVEAGVGTAVGVSGGLVYYAGRALWKLDAGGAVTKLAEFIEDLSYPEAQFVGHAGRAWLSVDDGVHGQELWTSDGTPAGTRLVRDIVPGPAESRAFWLVSAGDRLFFSATDGVHGEELWQTDGTEAGTRMVQDLWPGGVGARPDWLVAAEGYLYFLADNGLTGREVWALPLGGARCQAGDDRLCLNNGRFQAEAVWRDFQGGSGTGRAVPLTSDTGYFWFFNPANVEAVLKVLDGRGVNGHHWVFYGALSNVEYNLTVTDTETGLARRWFNPSGQFASVGDTTAFGPLGESAVTVATPSPLARTSSRIHPAAATGSCAPSSTRLCLNGDRFAVEVAWKDFQGKTGAGAAVELTGDTGYFWFFDPANVELVLKVLDGTPLNGHHWVFYGALSSVQYKITVTDTATGKIEIYENPSGRLASVGDTGAF